MDLPFTGDDGLSVTENGGDRVAAGALDIHKVRVRGLNQSLQFVGSLFLFISGVQKISFHFCSKR